MATTSFPGLFPLRWEEREKALASAGHLFILSIHENTNVWIPEVNFSFWLIDWIFLNRNLHVIKYFRESPCGTRLGRTTGENSKFRDFLLFMEQSTPKKVHLRNSMRRLCGDASESRHLLRVFDLAKAVSPPSWFCDFWNANLANLLHQGFKGVRWTRDQPMPGPSPAPPTFKGKTLETRL